MLNLKVFQGPFSLMDDINFDISTSGCFLMLEYSF